MAGTKSPAGNSAESETAVAAVGRMNAALRHRGPDDEGINEASSSQLKNGKPELYVCLGNTRLAIIDTSAAGHQPMCDPQSGNLITYNGETYNFRELRQEIGDEFGPWVSNTDTEVVLRAYRKWGVAAFGKLRGMFALAIWDAAKQELVLARDPFGIKPLYYYASGPEEDGVVFASELRALLASGYVPRDLSGEGVASYLSYGSLQAPLTIVKGVRALMPGKYLRVKAHETDRHELGIATFGFQAGPLDPKPVIAESSFSRREAVARLRTELEESVRCHLVSDVPLGVFLSGGMDSSALVALMSRVSEEKPKTFSVVFEEESFTEAPHSRLVAEKFHTEHCEVQLSDDRLLGMLPAAISSLDQPTMDGINTYVVSKAVKEAGVTVALSGLGGDELFAGYATFRRALRVESLSRLSRRLLGAAAGVGRKALNGSVQRRKFWQLAASELQPSDVYSITRQLFPTDEVMKLSMEVAAEVGNRKERTVDAEIQSGSEFDGMRPPDLINAISQLELRGYMANTLLRDTDCTSMAHSLEVRVPFVDVEVAGYVLSLPGEWKLNGEGGERPKPLLADALADLLPASFLARPKMGFTLPFANWMQSSLREEISSVLNDGERLTEAGIEVEEATAVWRRFLKSPQTVGWSRPWSLYVLAKWCEINGVSN